MKPNEVISRLRNQFYFYLISMNLLALKPACVDVTVEIKYCTTLNRLPWLKAGQKSHHCWIDDGLINDGWLHRRVWIAAGLDLISGSLLSRHAAFYSRNTAFTFSEINYNIIILIILQMISPITRMRASGSFLSHLPLYNFSFQPPLNFLTNISNPCFVSKQGGKSSTHCLPLFYLAGFPKCGTTDLWNRIMAEPDVLNVPVGAPHWLTRARFRFTGDCGYNTFCKGMPNNSVESF